MLSHDDYSDEKKVTMNKLFAGSLTAGAIILLIFGCTRFYAMNPVVSTDIVLNIGPDSATSGGWVSDEGGAPVTSRGICWSQNPRPTVEDSVTKNGEGLGYFMGKLKDLSPETNYYFRAYAINACGVAYGRNIAFTTTSKTH